MTIGGITSGLNLTLARLNSIERNFQALNNIAIELDLKQSSNIQGTNQNDFQNILDGKINKLEQELPKEEITPEKIEDELILEVGKEEENPVIQAESTPQQNENNLIEEISKEPNFKSKLDLKPQEVSIDEIIETISDKYNVDSNFIKAIIKQESGFNKDATSKKGAMGLMQLMPKTAKSLGIKDAYNPWENVDGGVRHIKSLLDKYSNNQELALAAYNAGEGAVKKYGGIPPYKETQNYVKSIMSAYSKTKEAEI